MQIHEITRPRLQEGLLSNVARGFAKGITGTEIPQGQASINAQAAQAAKQLRAQGYGTTSAAPTERIVVSFMQPGQTVPSKYTKTGNTWANEMGTIITDLRQKSYLDSLIPTHGKKELIAPVATQPTRKVSRARVPRGRTVKTR